MRAVRKIIVVLVFACVANAQAKGDDTRSREEEMFGADPDSSERAASESAESDLKQRDVAAERSPDDVREEAMFGDDSITVDTNMSERVQQNDNYLAIGGQLYLRYEWDAKAQGTLDTFPIVSPNMADLYFDARPTERLRGYLRGRLVYDPTVDPNAPVNNSSPLDPTREEFQVLLDEFWLKFDIHRTAFVTVGRQLVRWGSGHFWNPTDFVNTVHRDPLAVFDQRVGITLLKVDFPIESRNWNFYAVVDMDDGAALNQLDFIGRAEMLVGLAEFAVNAAKRPDGSLQLGLDISAGLGRFDLRFEGSLQHGLQTPFFTGSALAATPISRQGQWLAQIMGGAELAIKYNDEDSILLGVEYFYNQLGYDSAELLPVVVLNHAYNMLYFGRHYAAAFAQAARPGPFNNTTFILSAIANLSDMSALARADWIVRVLSYMDFNAFVTYHFGEHGELRYRIPDNIAVQASSKNLSYNTPVSEVGLGLRLYF